MQKIKKFIKEKWPRTHAACRNLKMQRWRFGSMEGKFTRIYRTNYWQSEESASGIGSNLKETAAIAKELPKIMKGVGARSLLDIPCGDFNWMKEVDLDIDSYIGIDIVDDLIQRNNQLWANNSRSFLKSDITKDSLPQVDMILCRDCLVHFSYDDISLALKNIKKSASKYLFTTTSPNVDNNKDILTGRWRPINLQKPPFRFPDPIALIFEDSQEINDTDKHLGLWKVADIPV
jgi:hypothetical protein